MNRRGFLKGLGISIAAAHAAPLFSMTPSGAVFINEQLLVLDAPLRFPPGADVVIMHSNIMASDSFEGDALVILERGQDARLIGNAFIGPQRGACIQVIQ